MADENTATTSILLHRIKTSLYALSTIILAGWVTDALNEELVFRFAVRYFFPDRVARYEHPLDSLDSFLLWGIPLLMGLLLMLAATLLTVHHIKKRHIYTLKKIKKTPSIKNIILAAEPDRLQEAFTTYSASQHIHLIHWAQEKYPLIEAAAKAFEKSQKGTVNLHSFPETQDLAVIANNLSLLIKKIHTKGNELAFDLSFASPLLGGAAMYCSLDTDMALIYPEKDSLIHYETTCVMED